MMPTIITMATMVAVTLPLPHSLWQGSFGFVTDPLSGFGCFMANPRTHVFVDAGCWAAVAINEGPAAASHCETMATTGEWATLICSAPVSSQADHGDRADEHAGCD